jgi:hypothetical protein
MPRARGARTPVYVTIGAMKYGFQASANSNAHRAALGQIVYTNQAGVFFGANSPKPNRATKEFATGSVGSFCDPSKEAELRTADWIITKSSRRRGIRSSGKTRTVFVGMPGGYNHAWNIPSEEMDLADELKFAQATASTPNLVWGVNRPKPPKASIRVGGSTRSTFIEPKKSTMDAAVAAGFSVSGVDYALLPET